MSVGINLKEDVYIGLLEIREQLLRDLDSSNIKYNVPFNKLNKQGIKETIVQIPDLSIEISIQNDIIKYIRSGCNEFVIVDNANDMSDGAIVHIRKIEDKITDLYGEEYSLKIERINTETMGMTIILSSKITDEKVRLQILKNKHNDIYINTMMAM